MKQIILMRHAKSSWSDPTHTDKERPLNSRGRAACTVMGNWLATNNVQPGHAVVSAARRVLETWQGIESFLDPPANGPVVKDTLYLAGPDAMVKMLQTTPETASSVLMIAHQPGTGALTHLLSGDDICADCSRAFSHFPTAAIAILEADIARWADLVFGTAAFRSFVCPKDLA